MNEGGSIVEAWEKQYRETLQWLETEPLLKNLNRDAPEPKVWYRKKMAGCVNAGGSDQWMYLKKGTTDHLVIFFIGGGFSFGKETAGCPGSIRDFFRPNMAFYTDECHPNNEYYFFHVLKNQGLLSLDPGNRFADWSIVMINYGTADMHIGNGVFPWQDESGQTRVLRHYGYRNFKIYLDQIRELFPAPDKLLITGVSAGGFGTSALSAEIVQAYGSCADVTICADSAFLRTPDWPRIAREVWKAPDRLAQAVTGDNIVLDLFRNTQELIGGRARYLFLCGYPDGVLATFQNYLDTGSFALTDDAVRNMERLLRAHIQALKALPHPFGIYLHGFQKNGMIQHCVLDAPEFRMGDISPMEWLWNAVNGSVTDVGLDLLK